MLPRALTILLLTLVVAIADSHSGPLAPSFTPPSDVSSLPVPWAQLQQRARLQLQAHPWLAEFVPATITPPLNRLILEDSPYLLQHAFQAIDWKPWPGIAGDKRLRFVSVGYSTCHWCHEMAEQAFSDPGIASLLNRHFVAVKVDREQHPEIDARYSRLQRLAGVAGGWPITVIENASGEALFVGAYLDTEQLLALLQRFSEFAERRPQQLDLLAAPLRQLEQAATQRVSAEPTFALDRLPSPERTGFLAREWDWRNGGVRGEQKFPDAPLLGWLLDASEEPRVAEALQRQLDQMLVGGLFDPLHGGFFRYATQSDWSAPHYEKMLGTQAQLVGIYATAARRLQRPLYLAVAEDLVRFVDDWLRDPVSGLYRTAVSARYHGVEGDYYRLADDVARDLDGRFEWFAPTRDQAAIVRARLTPQFLRHEAPITALAALRKQLPGPAERPFIDDKLLTGWNALLANGLLELDDEPGSRPRQRADAILTALARRVEPASGRVWRDQTRSVAGSLEDYAYLANALLALHARDLDPARLQLARSLLSHAAGRYLDDASATLLAADDELPAPLARLCAALAELVERLPDEATADSTRQSLADCTSRLAGAQQSLESIGWSSVQVVEATQIGRRRPRAIGFFAGGRGRAWLRRQADPEHPLRLDIVLADGWHINAGETGSRWLKPTRVTDHAGDALAARFPAGVPREFGFSEQPLSVYEHDVTVDLAGPVESPIVVQLQACSDRICLLPERLTLQAR